MNTDSPFLVYKHPVEGEILLSLAGDTICFSCRWPFDLSTDEWIYINNEFDREAYIHNLTALPEKSTVKIKGKQSGHIKFTILPSGKIKLNVASSQREKLQGRAQELTLTLISDLSAEDLIPSTQPRRYVHKQC